MAHAIESGNTADKSKTKRKRPPGRRFPFKAQTRADQARINQEVSVILQGVEDMLYRLVRTRVQSSLDESDIQDIVQQCRVWLWERSLPKYDAWRGVKISTFLYQCASNFINQEFRSINRQQSSSRFSVADPDLMLKAKMAADHTLDNQVNRVAGDVLANPEKYLTPSQVAVFRAVTDNPDIQMKELAKRLGYQRASSLSMMLRRIRERIAEISIEDFDDEHGDERE